MTRALTLLARQLTPTRQKTPALPNPTVGGGLGVVDSINDDGSVNVVYNGATVPANVTGGFVPNPGDSVLVFTVGSQWWVLGSGVVTAQTTDDGSDQSGDGTEQDGTGGQSSFLTGALPYGPTDQGWTTMTPGLTNGWTADTNAPQYRMMNGLVYLRGGLNGATYNTQAFLLPSGYRPSIIQHFPARATSSILMGQVMVQPGGGIFPNVPGGVSGTQYVSLSGVAFDPDGS